MFRLLPFLLFSIVLLAGVTPAWSDDGSTQLNITAHAEREIDNDLMTVQLAAERRASEVTEATAQVNTVMRRALEHVARDPAVEPRTLSYTTSPVYDRDRSRAEPVVWQVRQVLELTGRDFDSLTAIAGDLQNLGLAITEIHFSVSPESRGRVRQELLVEAIRQWQRVAQEMGAAIGASHVFPKQLSLLHDGFPDPRPMSALASGMEEMTATPALEAGRSTVRVTVSGEARAYGAATLRTLERR